MASSAERNDATRRGESLWAVWAIVGAFGTYFCMYGFRKPFTAATFDGAHFAGYDFKTIVVVTQVLGYMTSKFIGIKVISEMPARWRAGAILVLIGLAEAALALFGAAPRPWNVPFMFLNGLALGMVFGLVLGFLEGRRVTEALTACLCASFILAGGVTKTIGAWLLEMGVAEDWMPAAAGLLYLAPLCLFTGMLAMVPPPNDHDIAARCQRQTLTRGQRWELYGRYAGGLTLLVAMYLLITVVRGVRDDFAPELWRGLGLEAPPSIFTWSEFYVALGVIAVNGLAVLIVDNRAAFFVSLGTCCGGFVIVALALLGQRAALIGAFPFMVMVGLGLYLPYVAMHTTVFERMLAMTRERGNLGFLMYVADAYGYLGYVAVMISKNLWTAKGEFLPFFHGLCWLATALSLACLMMSWRYFAARGPREAAAPALEGVA